MQEVLEIIELFTRDLTKGFTINQISKLIKKSYGFANKSVHELIKHGILNKVKVGNAIYTTLNFRNPQTVLLLSLVSSSKIVDKNMVNYVNSLRCDMCVLCAYVDRGALYLVVQGSEVVHKKSSLKVELLDANEFKANSSHLDFKKLIIVSGYENFWKFIGETK